MRIGISTYTKEGHNIWNNGIGQNVYHLASLIEKIPFVERVVLINCGDQDHPPHNTGSIGERFPLLSLKDASEVIDVAIELAGGLNAEWTRRFRARGGRVVFHNCAQPYSALVEPAIFNRPSQYNEPVRCDAVWQLPKDAQFNALMAGIHRCPAVTVPFLWAPVFLKENIDQYSAQGMSFGYQPGALKRPVPSTFEPNISPIKMGIIPFLICETVNRETPDMIEHMNFLNGTHMAGHPTFMSLVGPSTLYTNKKMTITARDFFAVVMARGSNMVISHQLDCPQNYLYLDAIYGNYPLIHNSSMFDSVGYYYPDSDIDRGVEQFRLAVTEHDTNLDFHTQRNTAKIESLSPQNRSNRDAYARALLDVVYADKKGAVR